MHKMYNYAQSGYLCAKLNGGRKCGIAFWKVDVRDEDAAFVGTAYRPTNRGRPLVQIRVVDGARRDARMRLVAASHQLLLQARHPPVDGSIRDHGDHANGHEEEERGTREVRHCRAARTGGRKTIAR